MYIAAVQFMFHTELPLEAKKMCICGRMSQDMRTSFCELFSVRDLWDCKKSHIIPADVQHFLEGDDFEISWVVHTLAWEWDSEILTHLVSVIFTLLCGSLQMHAASHVIVSLCIHSKIAAYEKWKLPVIKFNSRTCTMANSTRESSLSLRFVQSFKPHRICKRNLFRCHLNDQNKIFWSYGIHWIH